MLSVYHQKGRSGGRECEREGQHFTMLTVSARMWSYADIADSERRGVATRWYHSSSVLYKEDQLGNCISTMFTSRKQTAVQHVKREQTEVPPAHCEGATIDIEACRAVKAGRTVGHTCIVKVECFQRYRGSWSRRLGEVGMKGATDCVRDIAACASIRSARKSLDVGILNMRASCWGAGHGGSQKPTMTDPRMAERLGCRERDRPADAGIHR